MGKVTTGGTMSLDGYIAGPEESGFDLLFQWYGNGHVEIPSASPDVPPPRISAASAELIKPEWENTGALVVGRHLYDMTNAWGGRHPMNVTTVVLTHRRPDDRPEDDENFVFVTDGIEAAVAKAKELAGDKNVAVNGGQMARQALEAGLLDEVGVELVPVVLGGGTPLSAELGTTPVQFEGPITVVEGTASCTCATGLRSRPPATAPPRLSYWRTRQGGPLRGPTIPDVSASTWRAPQCPWLEGAGVRMAGCRHPMTLEPMYGVGGRLRWASRIVGLTHHGGPSQRLAPGRPAAGRS
jgi:dihydrofolate reductase